MSIRTMMLFVIALTAIRISAEPQEGSKPLDVRVMSFNLRYATAADGENHWDKRKEILIDTIRTNGPDLLGTQECLAEQLDFLKEQFAEYDAVGVGRDDGDRKGEFSAVLFRKDRFEKIDSGTFWLSEHPEKVGEKSWDAALPRIATWVKLRDRSNDKELVFLNTHFDHMGKKARVESAKLIRRWIDANAQKFAVIISGDFNGDDSTEEYSLMIEPQKDRLNLTDTYRSLHAKAADERTFHAFKGDTKGSRIDYIFSTSEFTVKEADIDHTSKDGKFPSDHFPLTAVLAWK